MKRVQVVIRGEVQGVGFRMSCQREALRLGLTGWVRNLWDESVEALFEGPAEAVAAMLAWCHHGPPRAEVTAVEVTPLGDAPPQKSFGIRAF